MMATQPKVKAPWGEYVPWVGRMTVEQFERFPGEVGWLYELHQGRLIVMPGPGNEHGDIQGRLFLLLGAFIQRQGLGLLSGTSCYNLVLPDESEELLCPDLSYVTPARKAAMPQRGSYPVGAPDLAIEIASPSDSRPELSAKAAVYLSASVQQIWVIWPQQKTIDIWLPDSADHPSMTLQESDTLTGGALFPGFTCQVRDIFAR